MKTFKAALILQMLFMLAFTGSAYAQDEGYRPVPKSVDIHPAYIHSIFSKHGKTYIVADYIQWFEGSEADLKFKEREPDAGLEHAPEGYYIVNDNSRLRTLEVAVHPKVLMQIYKHGANAKSSEIRWNESVSFPAFLKIFAFDRGAKDYPYHLTVKNGKVVGIIQQYIP